MVYVVQFWLLYDVSNILLDMSNLLVDYIIFEMFQFAETHSFQRKQLLLALRGAIHIRDLHSWRSECHLPDEKTTGKVGRKKSFLN